MGGCYWDYFVPYESDVNAALQKLRDEVFRTKQYSSSGLMSEDSNADSESFDDENSESPATIEDLLQQEGESGTNSILDITHISQAPEFASVSLMPAQMLRKIFGTDKPTREMVEAKRGYPELTDDNPLLEEGWQGTFFTVYRGTEPDQIYFVGSSGDH
jgi:hypothetical protein